ncbi:MAG: aldehyde dehydrogenase [Putridiphycobacter sp.]
MEETALETIKLSFDNQKTFFSTQQTKSVKFRIAQLKKLKKAIKGNQQEIETALWKDLRKSPEEAYLTEISLVLSEIDLHILNLKYWAKPEKVRTPFYLFPSKSKIISEPLGLALIVAPWNYPFQLLFNPLVGAISSGCCSILKPSTDAKHIAAVMANIIKETFDPNYIDIFQGGKETNTHLFAQKFDTIFFTGSPMVGKVVMKAAAENLASVTLELGGKSPCIVDKGANIKLAAKRIAWGKLINAGQTCIAPDYIYVHESLKSEFLNALKNQITKMYGTNPKDSAYYPRIISDRAFDRLTNLLHEGDIVFGGQHDKADKYIAPTIIDNVDVSHPIMAGEIFGPLLPILTFKTIQTAIDYINKNEKPLAFYYFGKNKKAQSVFNQTTSGGGCINDTLLHIGNHNLPFGGVGNSGTGRYHGKASFDTFSNQRGVLNTPTWFDLPLKYVPFKWFKLTKKLV